MNGTPNQTLTQLNLPAHNHPATCSISVRTYSEQGTSSDPNGSILASTNGLYKTGVVADSSLTQNGGSVVVSNTGGNQPMNIEQPYLAMNYIICTIGIYPSRN
jgi:microcystin-dependent protein